MDIKLSDNAYAVLFSLYHSSASPQGIPDDIIKVLRENKLIAARQTGYNKTSGFPTYTLFITEYGRGYVDGHERSEKRYRFNETRAWITLAIACFGAVLGVLNFII